MALAAVAGCSDDAPAADAASCGPPADADAITVGGSPDPIGPFLYGGFTSSANNDCPAGDGAPTSISVEGAQNGTANALALCLPRPDLLGDGPVPLTDATRVQVISVYARDEADCNLELDPTVPLSGTVEMVGYCADGLDPAGYGLRLDGTLALRGPCGEGGAEASYTVRIAGTAPVVAE
jgi:hypothetical protein